VLTSVRGSWVECLSGRLGSFVGDERALAGSALTAPFDCDRDGGKCQTSVVDGLRVERGTVGVKWQIVN
jgi:hypothetical protein